MTKPLLSGGDWHPEDIKAAIRKTGVSLTALSVQNGYSVATVRMTLRRPSAPMQSLIAKHLGVAPQKIWPSRYDELGEPIDGRGRRRGKAPRRHRNSARKSAAQRQNHEEA